MQLNRTYLTALFFKIFIKPYKKPEPCIATLQYVKIAPKNVF